MIRSRMAPRQRTLFRDKDLVSHYFQDFPLRADFVLRRLAESSVCLEPFVWSVVPSGSSLQYTVFAVLWHVFQSGGS